MLLNEIIDEINQKVKTLADKYKTEMNSIISLNLEHKIISENKHKENEQKIKSLVKTDLSKLRKLEHKHYISNNDKSIKGYYIDTCYYNHDILRFIDRKGKVATVSNFYYDEKGKISFVKSFSLENYYDNNVVYLTLDRNKKTIHNPEGKAVYTENYYSNNQLNNIVHYDENEKKRIIQSYNRKGQLESVLLYGANGKKELSEFYIAGVLSSKSIYDENGKTIGMIKFRENGKEMNKSLYCSKRNIMINQTFLLNGNIDNVILYNESGNKVLYLNYRMNTIREKIVYDKNENKLYKKSLNTEGLVLSEQIFLDNKTIKNIDSESLISQPSYISALEIEKELLRLKNPEIKIDNIDKKDSISEKIKSFLNKINLKIKSKKIS